MFQAKTILGFSLRFLLVFGILIAPWPGMYTHYAKLFRASANVLFRSFGSTGLVHLQPIDQPFDPRMEISDSVDADIDTEVILLNREEVNRRLLTHFIRIGSFNLMYFAYMPTVLLVALVLATSGSWARRGTSLLLGVMLIHTWIVFKLLVPILARSHQFPPELSFYVLSPFWNKPFDILKEHYVLTPEPSFAVAVLVWLIVSFPGRNWNSMVETVPVSKSSNVSKVATKRATKKRKL